MGDEKTARGTEMQLQRIIGFSAPNSACITHHPANLIAYVSGATVVLYDCATKTQLRFYQSKSGQSFSCTAISRWAYVCSMCAPCSHAAVEDTTVKEIYYHHADLI